jgi:Tol biopolymer transport system component
VSPDRLKKIEQIYHQAREVEAGQRPTFLQQLCGDDVYLREQVERLFAEESHLESFLEPQPKPSWIGRRVGSHEFLALLGKGGMGEVYRARDLKLKRDVALKVLPEAFARDPGRMARFQREAEILASLNHPNIAAIYDLEEADGSRLLVLELVEGETLAERLKRGPIPLDEAVLIAKQIVDALEAAHDREIVHRDLKPGNVKRTPEGTVKVLDFGLAKVAQSALTSEQGFSNSPTLMGGSMSGAILGTAAYMSPEQARGQTVDGRTDIWAFGCLLYEMLTGKQAFTGETITDVLAKVLEGQPRWDALPAETPSSIRFLLEAALNKDPKQRLQHIGDAKLLLNRPATLDKSATTTVRALGSRRAWLAAAALIVALVGVLIQSTLYLLRAPEGKTAIRLEMATPGILSGTPTQPQFAISPDGQYVAYVAQADGKSAIWIRLIGEDHAQPLTGTENGSAPFWLPDSRNIAFFADGKLKKISITGGSATMVSNRGQPLGGTWNRDGIILFSAAPRRTALEIVRMSDQGGAITPVGLHKDGFVEVFPQFLPDARHFLYVSLPDPSGPGASGELYAGSLEGGPPVHIMSFGPLGIDFPGQYAAAGYLLFVRDGILMAQRFDEKRLALEGDPVAIAEHAGPFSVSLQQTLVYQPFNAQRTVLARQQVVWFDRDGKRGPPVGMPGIFGSLRLSPDGHRLALDRTNAGNTDVWVIDLDRGIPDKLTFDPAVDQYARWSPDGNRIVFASTRSGGLKMFTRSSVTGGRDQDLPSETPPGLQDIPHDWSRDGKYIVFVRRPVSGSEIWIKPMFGDEKPFPFVQANHSQHASPRLSPNSRWLAYGTNENETGTFQIVVHAFPDPNGKKWTVTAGGGLYPTWGRNGRELYYLTPDGKLMAVPVREDGNKLDFGKPTLLFQSPLTALGPSGADRYDASPDGNRFIFIANNNTNPANPNNSDKLSVILNWTALLGKK